ncbi:PstS family phosphate ABC transporter substrate-binding protein [Thermus sediminis]|uniref:PstS family phosphate ABC transporter substrate-binding protein n=1 Tax=Thermus sediminis TaxID=1761908 RepID=UPI000E3CE200|nr:PstS family phosphate ABC transporter substrate-binding protein [Thermus sediminis]
MSKKWTLGLAVLAVAGTGLAQIRADGSSTVYPITQAVAEEYIQRNPGVRIAVAFSGTGGGFRKFCRGETDIQNASRPIRKSELEECERNGIRFIEIPIAYDALTVVVSNRNTWATCLRTSELKAIWEPNSRVTLWSDVRREWPRARIVLYGPGTDSGTFDYFTEAIMGRSGASRTDFFPSEDDNIILRGVAAGPYTLGYFGFAYYEENKGKVKSVSIDNGRGCVAPSRESVLDGTYQPLARPLFIYVNVRSLERREVQDFLNFYLSPQARRAIRATGYVDLPADVYSLGQELVNRRRTGTFFMDLPPATPLSRFVEELRRELR